MVRGSRLIGKQDKPPKAKTDHEWEVDLQKLEVMERILGARERRYSVDEKVGLFLLFELSFDLGKGVILWKPGEALGLGCLKFRVRGICCAPGIGSSDSDDGQLCCIPMLNSRGTRLTDSRNPSYHLWPKPSKTSSTVHQPLPTPGT